MKIPARPLRRVTLLSVLAILFSLAAGCGKRESAADRGVRENVLYRSIGADAAHLDPALATGINEYSVISALFEGLVSPDPKTLKPEPAAAESWTVSATGKIYTFKIRTDAKWSDGQPLTADDFVASFRRTLTPSLGSPDASLLYVLANAQAYHTGAITDFAQVGAQALDAHTLKLTLTHPVPYFLTLLTHWVWYPVPPAVIKKYGAPADRATDWTRPGRLVGNGPFRLTARVFGQYTRVERNPFYWDANRVRLSGIVFDVFESVDAEERAFRAGQIHITDALPIGKIDAYRRAHSPALRIAPYLGTYFYRLNVTNPALRDPRVRRALAMAVDRQAIVDKILKGGERPAYALTPPETAGYTPEAAIPSDPAKARELLAAAGFPGGNGFPTLNILFNTSENHRIIAEAIQEMWRRELGINTELVNEELTVYLDSRRRLDYDICRSSWIGDYIDPSTFLGVFTSASGNNQTGWSNSRYDSLLAAAGRESDEGKRFALYQQAEAILLDEAPIIPIYYYTHVGLVDPRVKGWDDNILDRHPYKYVYLEANRK